MEPEHVEAILADSARNYLAANQDCGALPEDRWMTVRYSELIEDSRAVVESIYHRFDLPGPDPALRTALDEAATRQRDRASQHSYALEEFGITESRLRHDFAPVFERYGF